ncbi:MAG: sigma-70 family RNA polymerase sigma factor [Kiritimatiellae bacterium]|nr:sigma-70 family RNA polymerase sigma factor [Kiritimatiellia bacterium]
MSEGKEEFLGLFLRNQAAFHAFVIARGVRPDDAEDVVQNIATVLWKKFGQYKPGTNFRAWAFAVARIEILRFFDRRKRNASALNLDEETLERLDALEVDGHPDLIEFKERALVRCLSRLGGQARELVNMRYVDTLSFDEIAGRVRKSATALRIKMCRIRKWLRDCVVTALEGAEA